MNRAAVVTEKLAKVYAGGKVVALDDVDLAVEQGEFVSILGPSGSGKTTLLGLIGTMDKPTSGRVLIEGRDISQVRDIDRFRAQKVGLVFQLHNLIPTLDSLENVQVPMSALGVPAAERKKRTHELLTAVGLEERLHHRPADLSVGERQRVAIARALANGPSLLLADEPTGNLDPATGSMVVDLLSRLNKDKGVTLIVATHDQAVATRANRILRLEKGRIV
jgi:putative ABC transport system ATP-binding protein